MEKKLTAFTIVYFLTGLVFAIAFALFYHWPWLSFFSPRFFSVVLTWPFQFLGFFYDFQYYGLQGKVLY